MVINMVNKEEYLKLIEEEKKIRKYRNRYFHIDILYRGRRQNILFHSQKEGKRASELIMLQKLKLISNLMFQDKFIIFDKNKESKELAVNFIIDFTYYDNDKAIWVAEDTKSPKTKRLPSYVIKRKLFKARYPKWKFIES
jgi:hypothetical protein